MKKTRELSPKTVLNERVSATIDTNRYRGVQTEVFTALNDYKNIERSKFVHTKL